jgi:hypothetical protein
MQRAPDQTPSAAIPRPEHPRPDLVREPWICLNGPWEFQFDPKNVGERRRWHRPTSIDDPFTLTITVPFPWESRLSGVCDPKYQGAAWYRREIVVPEEWVEQGLHPVLHFGAVDWNSKVWVNGRFVGEHDGGYSPFACDLSRHAHAGSGSGTGAITPARPNSYTVTLRAFDISAADTPLGKQTDNWYTPSSGIWQPVWLEGRSPTHVSQVHLSPDVGAGQADATVEIVAAAGSEAEPAGRPPGPLPVTLLLSSPEGAFPAARQMVLLQPGRNTVRLSFAVPHARLWSPESPHLYDVVVELLDPQEEVLDRVQTYFGMREIRRDRWDGRAYEYVLLNGEPVYLRGALDQAFHPDSLHAYPSDDVIRGDIQAARDLGLNMLRCHIKLNDPRYYYWADRLGVLVMSDIPSASVYTPKARQNWEMTLRAAVARDFNHPSVFSWILFNETWGLEEHQTPAGWTWVREMFDLARSLDATRLIEDNSACLYDHVATDLNTWHFYISEYDRARRHIQRVVSQTFEGSPFNYTGEYRQETQPLLNSEYAGLSASQGDKDIAYTFKFLTTEMRRHDKICGYVYTELTDIEWEHNGLLNYDRSRKEFGYEAFVEGMSVRDLTAADVVGLDAPPCQTLAPGSRFAAPVFFSHYGPRRLEDATVRWRLDGIDRFGERRTFDEGSWSVAPPHYGATGVGTLETELPREPCLATIALWVADEAGQADGPLPVVARNYVNVDVHDGPASDVEQTPSAWVLRREPGDFAASTWDNPRLGPKGSKFAAAGAGMVEYRFTLPDLVATSAVRGLRLRFEAAARTSAQRIAWKAEMQATDQPQTEERKIPTDVTVSLNGVELATVRLPDDPADARGVLSHHLTQWDLGSYGFLTDVAVPPERLAEVLAAAEEGTFTARFEVRKDAEKRGGLSLYGARMGASPIDVLLFVETD